MTLKAALSAAGMELVELETDPVLSMKLRVSLHPAMVERWKSTIVDLLGPVSVDRAEKGGWHIDISQVYFVRAGVPKYYWRVVISGKIKTGLTHFLSALKDAAGPKVELMEMPLIGAVRQEPDPDSGRIKGGYTPSDASRLRSKAL